MDPYPSQQHAGLQDAVLLPQQRLNAHKCEKIQMKSVCRLTKYPKRESHIVESWERIEQRERERERESK